MRRPKWLATALVTAIHDEAIYEFGGLGGIRDPGLLESALDRPRNKLGYEPKSTVFELAASLCLGLAKNHPFVDGNKRIAFMAMMGFLLKNDIAFDPEPAQSTTIILSLAAGEVSEESLTRWIRDNWPPDPRT